MLRLFSPNALLTDTVEVRTDVLEEKEATAAAGTMQVVMAAAAIAKEDYSAMSDAKGGEWEMVVAMVRRQRSDGKGFNGLEEDVGMERERERGREKVGGGGQASEWGSSIPHPHICQVARRGPSDGEAARAADLLHTPFSYHPALGAGWEVLRG